MNKPEKTFPIKSPEIETIKEEPFKHCKLGREKYAEILTRLVSHNNEGFVLALNNKWGSGKSTFANMWNQYLKNQGFSTVMFNAWENDFVSNPLTALIAEFKNLNEKDIKGFKTVVDKASRISKALIPTLIKAALYKYLDADELKGLIEGSVDSFTDSFKNEVDDYEKQKNSIVSFKTSLSKYVADNSNGKPVIFIIDELDRCRPNYAVSILEAIKHLFSIPNVVFVLSIDKFQLESAICGVYGSDNIDAVEYLRKFIDIEYSLPEPKPTDYLQYLFDRYDFLSFFKSQPSHFTSGDNLDLETFKNITSALLGKLTLRNQEKILSHLRVSLLLHGDINDSIYPTIYVFLVYCKIMERDFYSELMKQDKENDEILKDFYKVLGKVNSNNYNLLTILEAYFMTSYSFSKFSENKIFSYDFSNGSIISEFTSMYDKNNIFHSVLKNIDKSTNMHSIKISKLLGKINLVDDFNLS